jgi:NAD(P)-dependent dehydrogenase (short-subunit alcohol dehydrogenase family)
MSRRGNMGIIDDLFSLEGKTALVTGGSSGIGRAMGFHLATAGARVVYMSQREEKLREAVSDIESIGAKGAYVAGDVSDLDKLPGMCERAGEFFGSPDILVNAAGVNLREPWDKVSSETWSRTLAVNLTAPFFLARLLVPTMMKKGWGKIINIGSLQSIRAFPNSAPYGASKGGILQLTRAMAEAWSKDESGITCNAIGPGFFKTGLTAPLYNDENVIKALARQTIIGRNGELSDLAGLTVFLASRASDYITGQLIFLDGGWTAK